MASIEELTRKFKLFDCNLPHDLKNKTTSFNIEDFPHTNLGIDETRLKKCAWLLLIFHSGDEFYVLLTIRSFKLKSYPGEICYPGGMFDDSLDKTFEDTALREANEEINLNRKNVKVLCKLCPLISPIGHYISPIIGLLVDDHGEFKNTFEIVKALQPNPSEVEAIFWVPFGYFLDATRLKDRVNLTEIPVNLDRSLLELDKSISSESKFFRIFMYFEDALFQQATMPQNQMLYGINATILLFVITVITQSELLTNVLSTTKDVNVDIFDYLKILRLKTFVMYRDYLIKKEEKKLKRAKL